MGGWGGKIWGPIGCKGGGGLKGPKCLGEGGGFCGVTLGSYRVGGGLWGPKCLGGSVGLHWGPIKWGGVCGVPGIWGGLWGCIGVLWGGGGNGGGLWGSLVFGGGGLWGHIGVP